MAFTQIPNPYGGIMPQKGDTSEENLQACIEFRDAELRFWSWLHTNYPNFNTVYELGDKFFDTSKYKGEHDPNSVYNLGESISVGADLYISKIDGNGSTPPGVNWTKFGFNKDEYKNALLNESTTGLNFDPNSLDVANKDHVNIFTRHANCPNSTNYWHINTQWQGSNKNCSQIAVIEDKNKEYVYVRTRFRNVWGSWKELAFRGVETNWTQATLINGWTGDLKYKKYADGTVHVSGYPYNSSGESSYHWRNICVLPSGFRPTKTIYSKSQSQRGGFSCMLILYTNGILRVQQVGGWHQTIDLVFRTH